MDDGTAKVPVDPDGADLRLSVHGRTVRAGESLPEYDPLREFLEIEGEREGSAWARNVLRAGDPTTIDRVASVLELNGPTHWEFVEYLLEPDEPVHVYGVPAPRRTESHEVGVVHAVFASRGLPKGSTGRTLALKPTDRPLVISEGTESEAESWALYGGLVRVTVGALAVGVGALSLLASFTG